MTEPNPYAPSSLPPPPKPEPKGKEPFSTQAAKFSLYAPFVLMVMGFLMRSVLGRGEQAEMARENGSDFLVNMAVGIIQLVTTLAAFGLGWVGLVGGIQCQRWSTVAMATGGLLINFLILAASVVVIVMVLQRSNS